MPTESAAQRLLPHLRRVALARDPETGDGHLLGAFVSTRDEAAFSALVRRHGPMVLGVCSRVIGDPHLAEDAFQATFLVLARRAATVRPRHLVGHWLYGVAYRTALKARGAAVRRMAKEKQVDAMPHPPVSLDEAWADLQPVLDAELARLPEKYRVPVVLCDLGGRPQRDVARELRLPPATLANRLAAARRLLAKRLTQRGVALSAGAVVAALGWHAATSAVPPALAGSTVKAACAAASGTAVGLPVPVVQLSDGVMRMFVLNKLKAVATGLATCLVVLPGLGLLAGPSLRAEPEQKPTKPSPPVKLETATQDPHRPPPDDLTFLRRISLDLRGTLPSRLEAHYFLADTDPKKRGKIVEWMLPEHGRQKATEACTVCHEKPFGPPMLSEIPYLNRLFKNVGNGHPTGAAMVDFDNDGFLDVFIANEAGNALLTNPHALDPAVEVHRAAAKKVHADVAAAQAELADIHKVVNPESKTGRELIDRARAKVAAAEAGAKAADLSVQEAQAEVRRKYLIQRMALAKQVRADDVARDIEQWLNLSRSQPSDAEFLRRIVLDVTGAPPTTVEEKYFTADKDPNKREKLLGLLLAKSDKPTTRDKIIEELLSDPEIQKVWASRLKTRMLEERLKTAHEALNKKPTDCLDRLLAELLDKKKSDEQMLNALCLATMARYPTETEQKLILDAVKAQPDRGVTWQGVLKTLAATEEAKAHGAELSKRNEK
jgi:RNA polymerase sigma factor (sigma-70 family)